MEVTFSGNHQPKLAAIDNPDNPQVLLGRQVAGAAHQGHVLPNPAAH
nr:MAG TPA: hypothetical protein [Bacteriophage sp.]